MRAVAALLVLLACGRSSAQTLTVGSKRFTESYVLGEILSQTAKGTHKPGLGNTAILLEALQGGRDRRLSGVHRHHRARDPQVGGPARPRCAQREAASRSAWPRPFRWASATATRSACGARTPSGSASARSPTWSKHPTLRFGLSHEFLGRRDGWPGLQGAYGLPQKPRGLDHGIAYEALAAGEIDVMDLYTTDAKIERYAIVALDDDRRFFPPYDAVLLYRAEVPQRFPKEFALLGKLENTIDAQTMVRLNARAEIDKVSFADVAREYLGSKVEARRGLWSAVFAPDFGRLLAEHLGLVFGSLAHRRAGRHSARHAGGARAWLAQPVLVATGLLQTIPSLALLAFLIPLTGTIGVWPALIALFLYALLPITRNTHIGITEVRRGLVDAGTALGLSRRRILVHVELPLALPVIMAGVKTAAVINVGTATIAAFIGAGGFGERITQGLALNDHTMLLAGALPAAVLALRCTPRSSSPSARYRTDKDFQPGGRAPCRIIPAHAPAHRRTPRDFRGREARCHRSRGRREADQARLPRGGRERGGRGGELHRRGLPRGRRRSGRRHLGQRRRDLQGARAEHVRSPEAARGPDPDRLHLAGAEPRTDAAARGAQGRPCWRSTRCRAC